MTTLEEGEVMEEEVAEQAVGEDWGMRLVGAAITNHRLVEGQHNRYQQPFKDSRVQQELERKQDLNRTICKKYCIYTLLLRNYVHHPHV